MSEYIYATDGEVVQNMLSEVFEPLQEIVRCRDCREYHPELYRTISCELLGRYFEPDEFCSRGERKD